MIKDNVSISSSNTDDIFIRNATAALLSVMDNKVEILQTIDGVVTTNKLPVYYSFGNDENFMKDFFINNKESCIKPYPVDGNFEMWPNGVITLKSLTIKSEEILNKFVRASFRMADADGQSKVLKAYSAYLFSIPVSLKFDFVANAKFMNHATKIMEGIIRAFYKQNVVFFQYGGMKIPAQVQFSEDSSYEKKFEFNYEDENAIKLPTVIEMETFLPILDDATIRYKGDRILQFISSMNGSSSEVIPI
jgi:hypothetical protein